MNRIYLSHQQRMKNIVNMTILFGTIILLKYFHIQIIGIENFDENLFATTGYTKDIKGDRGRIYDRNGVLLAGNITKIDLWVNTQKDFDVAKINRFFEEFYDLDSNVVSEKLSGSKKKYVAIKKNIIPEDISRIIKEVQGIKGLNIDKYSQRFYPYEEICSQVVGYTNKEGNGRTGIELEFNEILNGKKIKEVFNRSVNSKWENRDKANFNYELNGKDIYLAIDIKLQEFLYQALVKGQENSLAKAANGIIVDPLNGDVLAMAGTPSFNPNNFSNYNIERHRNNVISKQYEPGSTIKVIPVLGAIDAIGTDIKIDCENGEYEIPNTQRVVKDHEAHNLLSIDEVLIHSSNIGIVKISNILGKEETYSALRKFGLGSKTGIKLPGEENGKIAKLRSWSKTTHSAVSFGQELSVTDLQLSMIYASIANNGFLLKPKIVKRIFSPKNSIEFDRVEIIRQVMEYEDSKILIDMLSSAVSEGTGQNAAISGYEIAGKTGTAEKFVEGQYSKSDFISSFAAIFPASDPQYVCVVSVDSPEYHKHWGNITAAPIAREVFVEIINNNFLTKKQETT